MFYVLRVVWIYHSDLPFPIIIADGAPSAPICVIDRIQVDHSGGRIFMLLLPTSIAIAMMSNTLQASEYRTIVFDKSPVSALSAATSIDAASSGASLLMTA